MKTSLTLVKIGGNIIDDQVALSLFLQEFATLQGNKILIHGGGKVATQTSQKLGIETQMVDGRRITGNEEIKVVTMVYAGLINKTITAQLNAYGLQTLGLSGVDVHLIPAVKRAVKEIDYGFVGDILTNKINTNFLKLVLDQNITPVIAPIASDSAGNLLNVNADTIACALAVALNKYFDIKLALCFEKKGVLSDPADDNSAIAELTLPLYETYKQQGIISKGMLPKTENAFFAATNGVKVVIGHALDINKTHFGTTFTI